MYYKKSRCYENPILGVTINLKHIWKLFWKFVIKRQNSSTMFKAEGVRHREEPHNLYLYFVWVSEWEIEEVKGVDWREMGVGGKGSGLAIEMFIIIKLIN